VQLVGLAVQLVGLAVQLVGLAARECLSLAGQAT
jgi:hypothetical protein